MSNQNLLGDILKRMSDHTLPQEELDKNTQENIDKFLKKEPATTESTGIDVLAEAIKEGLFIERENGTTERT